MNYRPEIDGFRSIAIIFIIPGHLNSLDFVTGGVNFFSLKNKFYNHLGCIILIVACSVLNIF